MKKISIRFLISGLILILVAVNIAIFVSGMQLSQKVNYYEQETQQLHQDNLELEQKVYDVSSLAHAASVAAQLDFTKKAEPYHLQQIGFALKR